MPYYQHQIRNAVKATFASRIFSVFKEIVEVEDPVNQRVTLPQNFPIQPLASFLPLWILKLWRQAACSFPRSPLAAILNIGREDPRFKVANGRFFCTSSNLQTVNFPRFPRCGLELDSWALRD